MDKLTRSHIAFVRTQNLGYSGQVPVDTSTSSEQHGKGSIMSGLCEGKQEWARHKEPSSPFPPSCCPAQILRWDSDLRRNSDPLARVQARD